MPTGPTEGDHRQVAEEWVDRIPGRLEIIDGDRKLLFEANLRWVDDSARRRTASVPSSLDVRLCFGLSRRKHPDRPLPNRVIPPG
jgi:hypothetical protein